MMRLLLSLAAAIAIAGPAVAQSQSETAARRECMQAMRQQGVRGFAMEYPRYIRTSEGASLNGQMVQGPVRIDFACALDRRATVLELTMTRRQPD